MKELFQNIKKGIAIGFGFGMMLIMMGVTYAVWNYTTSVNSGDSLTAEMWNSLKDAVQNQSSFLVPSGQVSAFNLASCPTGWTEVTAARGRTIIGVNPNTANGLSVRALNGTVGEERHTQTIPEMPSFIFNGGVVFLKDNSTGVSSGTIVDGNFDFYPGTSKKMTKNEPQGGSGQAFNVMQPSIVFLYCQKN